MSRTPKNHAALYLSLLITIVLGVAMPSARAQKPSRDKHNGKIVFISDRDYKGLSVWSMNPDGSTPTRLTDDTSRGKKLPDFSPVYDSSPAWSPDGKKIAFISNRDIYFSLYVMNADGSNQRILPNPQNNTGTGFGGGQPVWSPDGTKILFTSARLCGRTAPAGIYVVNVDGGNSRLLTNDQKNCGSYGSARWSPDGTKILAGFAPEQKGILEPAPQIVVMDADGSNQIIFRIVVSMASIVGSRNSPMFTPTGSHFLRLISNLVSLISAQRPTLCITTLRTYRSPSREPATSTTSHRVFTPP